MELIEYKNLIANLPVKQQAFTTKRSTWKKWEDQFPWFKAYNEELFGSKAHCTISREDIFQSKNIRDIVVKTILWGYPRGLRGQNFQNILLNIDPLHDTLTSLQARKTSASLDLDEVVTSIGQIPGLGFSTLTKLIYFMEFQFEGKAALILDQRIINCLNEKKFRNFMYFPKLNYSNKEKHYKEYLYKMDDLASELRVPAENLEQFLFLFHGLKPNASL